MATGDLRQKFSGTRDNNLDFPEQLRARRTPTIRLQCRRGSFGCLRADLHLWAHCYERALRHPAAFEDHAADFRRCAGCLNRGTRRS